MAMHARIPLLVLYCMALAAAQMTVLQGATIGALVTPVREQGPVHKSVWGEMRARLIRERGALPSLNEQPSGTEVEPVMMCFQPRYPVTGMVAGWFCCEADPVAPGHCRLAR